MSHEPKSPSLGMISTATRTTATVSPLTPSPLNGSIVANGSPAAQSAHSGFAAALRKLAKQAEEPRGKAAQPVQQGCDTDDMCKCARWHRFACLNNNNNLLAEVGFANIYVVI